MLDTFKENKRTLLLFIFILLLSFSLRFTRVMFQKQPVFGDEAIYVRWSQIMRSEPSLRFVPLSDGKQPLFMWVTIPFLKIFDDPLIAARILSVYTGTVTTAGLFFLTLLLFKSVSISLLVGFLYAISPFSTFFESMALADSMLSMFGVWSLVFAVIVVRKKRLDAAMFSGFCLGGAYLTKSPAQFFALFLPIVLILHRWPKKYALILRDLSVFLFHFFFTYAIAYGLYNILRLGENFHMIALRNQDYVNSIEHILNSPFDPLLPFLRMILEYFWFLGPSILILLIFLGIYLGTIKYKKVTLVLIFWGLAPIFLVSEFSKTMTARYVFFALPYLFVLSVVPLYKFFKPGESGINKSANGKKSLYRSINYFLNLNFGKKLLIVAFIIYLVHAFYVNLMLIFNPQNAKLPRGERSGYFEEWTSGYGIAQAADYIINYHETNPEENIVIGTEGYFGTLPDGLMIYLNEYPEIKVIGVGIDLKEIPQSLLNSVESGNQTYLLINNSRLKTDYNKLNLNLVALYQKAFRKEGTLEYNLNGPQEVLYLFEVEPSGEL